MNPTSEELKDIFYSGYPGAASWDILDEIAIAIHTDALQYRATPITSTEAYHSLVDTVGLAEGPGPQGKGHTALKALASEWLIKEYQVTTLSESYFTGLHPDVRSVDGQYIVECGTTDPSCVEIYLRNADVLWVANLPYPFAGEPDLVLHIFSRGSQFFLWQEEKRSRLRSVFQKYHK